MDFWRIAVILGLFVHGSIHLLGTVVYTGRRSVRGFQYKTTLLGGRWDLGPAGMRGFGILWAVAALGFGIAGAAWWAGLPVWRGLLTGVTLFSLGLTVFDWEVAYAGALVNLVILVSLVLGPRIRHWLA